MKKFWLAAVALAWAAGVSAVLLTAPAQQEAEDDTPIPPWVRMTIVDVNPAMIDEFLAVQRELMTVAQDDEIPWRGVNRSAVFGNPYRFLIFTPADNLAAFDGIDDGIDPALMSRLQKTITSEQSYAIRTLPEISNPLADGDEPNLMVFNIARIAAGRELEYYEIMKTDFLPHFDEAEVNHITGSLTFGGQGGYIHTFYYDDMGDLDQGSPVLRALGAEKAQEVTESFAGIVTGSEMFLATYLPELSYSELPEDAPTGRGARGRGGRGGRGGSGGGRGGADPADTDEDEASEEEEEEDGTLTGCFNKAEGREGYYILTDKDTGEATTVTGIRGLEPHSTNHEVSLTGAITEEDGEEIFTATAIEHIASTCSMF